MVDLLGIGVFQVKGLRVVFPVIEGHLDLRVPLPLEVPVLEIDESYLIGAL